MYFPSIIFERTKEKKGQVRHGDSCRWNDRLGKSSVAEILGEHFNQEVFYESVDDNPILPLFYSETEEEIHKK